MPALAQADGPPKGRQNDNALQPYNTATYERGPNTYGSQTIGRPDTRKTPLQADLLRRYRKRSSAMERRTIGPRCAVLILRKKCYVRSAGQGGRQQL